jgi:hypothetical protein
MSMYLPNPDLRPTGFEPAEYIDIPATVEEDHPMSTHGPQSGPAYLRGMPVSTWTDATMARRPLSDQTRVNITRWAEEYISGLVRNHHGDSEDVRSVIHDLHLECTLAHDQ